MWMPIDPIFRGGGCNQTPVSPSSLLASRPSGATVRISASSRSRTYFWTSCPCRVRSRIGKQTSWPGAGYVDLPPGLGPTAPPAGLCGVLPPCRPGPPAERDDRRVLEEDHGVGDRAL